MNAEDLVSSLTGLAEVLQTQRTLGGALARIAEAATVSVPRCDAATVAISIEGRPSTAAISARIALELDMVQYDTDEGPCLTCFRTAGLPGLLMINEACTVEQAEGLLREATTHDEKTILQIAHRIIEQNRRSV